MLSDLISIEDLTKDQILAIIDRALQLKKKPEPDLLKGKILGNCFFEPSTRTRLSFESAMLRLGGSIIGFSDGSTTSAVKGESLHDTMRMLEHYAHLIVLRHPLEGAARLAAEAINIPVINAGDGSNQHPTQTLLDLLTIHECRGCLDGTQMAIVGDLKHARTAHTLILATVHFNMRVYLVAPPNLELPKEISQELREKRIKFSYHESLEEILPKLDIIYMTRLQKERFSDKFDYPDTCKISLKQLKLAPPHLKILHPLPRVDEIHRDIDKSPFAHYFAQAENGLYIRQALLAILLKG